MKLTSLVARSLANSLTEAAIEHVYSGRILLKNGICVVVGRELASEELAAVSESKKIVWFGEAPADTSMLGV